MNRIEVHKFGGTSLADAGRYQQAARLLVAASAQARVIAVASASAGTTDALLQAADLATHGQTDEMSGQIESLLERHRGDLAALDPAAPEVGAELSRLGQELTALLRGVALVGELTARTRDRVLAVGEKLSIRLLAAALSSQGAKARALDADTFLETDGRFGQAAPLAGVADRTLRATLRPLMDAGTLPVVTGFCGRAPDGATTTLGRGGSDLSATLIAAAVAADEVTLWTDVDGIFSGDPRVVPETRVVQQLNFREAAELSYYGAKVLHPRAMIPVATQGIPTRIRNSFSPDHPGSVVDGRFTPGSHPVKAISAVRGQRLLSIEGKGMSGLPGVAARVFSSLARREISVTMISQSSSESSICLAVPSEDAGRAEAELKREFRPDLSRGDVEEIAATHDVSLVAAVGLGMAHTPGVAARVFTCLGSTGINVLAIAQGSSELNISLAVEEDQTDRAVRALHLEFGLHRLDTGQDRPGALDLLLLGCGNVGRALVEQILDRRAHVFARFGLAPRIVALADRSGHLFEPTGLPREELLAAMEAKAAGKPLAEQPRGRRGDATALLEHALAYRLSRPVLVDVSNADGADLAFQRAFELGCDVVTANKKPLAGTLDTFDALTDPARAKGRILRAEATVGAGLPVVDTLQMLLHTGDALTRAEGCLSGTLGFVMTRLEEGQPFSQVVAEAAASGYTEPDPVADLSGEDVARKAIILGRLSGLVRSDEAVRLEGLVDTGLAGLPRDELIAELAKLDGSMADKVARARDQDMVLRYLASVSAEGIRVGPLAVPAESPFAMLRGTDNLIVFTSERYQDRPLVVSGPGAGIEVTAMGVLGDVLRIAAERRQSP